MEVDHHPGDEERINAAVPSSQSGLKFQLHAVRQRSIPCLD
jgi:hypothetical protein